MRSDAAPWMFSSRQCRMGPDLERSTPTSSDVVEEGGWQMVFRDQVIHCPVGKGTFQARTITSAKAG